LPKQCPSAVASLVRRSVPGLPLVPRRHRSAVGLPLRPISSGRRSSHRGAWSGSGSPLRPPCSSSATRRSGAVLQAARRLRSVRSVVSPLRVAPVRSPRQQAAVTRRTRPRLRGCLSRLFPTADWVFPPPAPGSHRERTVRIAPFDPFALPVAPLSGSRPFASADWRFAFPPPLPEGFVDCPAGRRQRRGLVPSC
jgi:hypothetical protein